MTASYVFEVVSETPAERLLEEVERLWVGDFVDVLRSPRDRTALLCECGYAVGGIAEESAVRAIVKLLSAAAIDRRVYYYRCRETVSDAATEFYEIEIDRIFDRDMSPALYDGPQLRHLIAADQ